MVQLITGFCHMAAVEYMHLTSKAFNCFVEILREFLCRQREVNLNFILFLINFLSFRDNLDRKLFIELEGFSHESSQDEKMGFLSKSF